MVVRHRPLRRLPRRLRHRGRGDGGPRREGELARRPPAGPSRRRPRCSAPAGRCFASSRIRARTSPRPRRATSSGTSSSSPHRGRRFARRPLSRAAHFESAAVRASRSRLRSSSLALRRRPEAEAGRYRGVPLEAEESRHAEPLHRLRRSRAVNAARLAAALSERAEAVCRQYLPHGRRQGRYWVAGDLDGARGRSLYVRLRPARHAGEVDRRRHRRARRPPRPRAPPLARADASRGARRGPRLPRPAGCAGRGRGRGRCLRRDGGRAPSLGALPRHRRHPRGSAISTPGGSRAAASRLLALPPRASLSRRLVRAAPPGAGRRRDRRRRRRHRRAAHLARPPLARQGGRRVAQEGARAHLRPRGALRPPRRRRFAPRRRGHRDGALARHRGAGGRRRGRAHRREPRRVRASSRRRAARHRARQRRGRGAGRRNASPGAARGLASPPWCSCPRAGTSTTTSSPSVRTRSPPG